LLCPSAPCLPNAFPTRTFKNDHLQDQSWERGEFCAYKLPEESKHRTVSKPFLMTTGSASHRLTVSPSLALSSTVLPESRQTPPSCYPIKPCTLPRKERVGRLASRENSERGECSLLKRLFVAFSTLSITSSIEITIAATQRDLVHWKVKRLLDKTSEGSRKAMP
jgi:hypothetical protein